MEFLSTIGLDSKYVDPDKYKLSKIFIKDCASEYTPANGTTGIVVNVLKNEDGEQVKSTKQKDPCDAVKIAVPPPVEIAPAPDNFFCATNKKSAKMKPKSPNDFIIFPYDFIIFPYANIRYGNEFYLRRIKSFSDMHKSEIFETDEPFVLHKTVNNVSMEDFYAANFYHVVADVYKYGAVSTCTSHPNNAMKTITGTIRDLSNLFKFNCLLKFNGNTEGMQTKYGPASLVMSIIQPSQFLPVFGKEDGCIIHISLINKKGIVFDMVGLATNEEESIFLVDGDLLYTKSYINPFISTTIPHIKKYAKYIRAALGEGSKGKVAQVSKN